MGPKKTENAQAIGRATRCGVEDKGGIAYENCFIYQRRNTGKTATGHEARGRKAAGLFVPDD
jgi:hypothetical protein